MGLRDEVRLLGYKTVGGPEDAGKALKDIAPALERLDVNRTGAVVCGLDQHLNYYKMAVASQLVRKGVPLYASNDDARTSRAIGSMALGPVWPSGWRWPPMAGRRLRVSLRGGRGGPPATRGRRRGR